MIDWSNVFAEALSYGEFLDSHANQSQRERWDAMHARFALTPAQQGLLNAFTRRMPVICLTGAWCGDCINQCPVFDHLAQAAPVIELRFLDRDALPAVREERSMNGGTRSSHRLLVRLAGGFPIRRANPVDLPQAGSRPARPVYPDRTCTSDQQGSGHDHGRMAGRVCPSAPAGLSTRLSPRLRSKHGD